MNAKGSTARIHMAGPSSSNAHQRADRAFNPDLENAALPGLQHALRGGPPPPFPTSARCIFGLRWQQLHCNEQNKPPT